MPKGSIFLTGALAAVLAFPAAAIAADEPVMLLASLDGASETAGGDEDGSGNFSAEANIKAKSMCYALAVSGIGDATAAHIHAGAAGADGKPVIPLEVTGSSESKCVDADAAVLKAIVAAPANYYVNVHTKDFPAGAVRGQLEAD